MDITGRLNEEEIIEYIGLRIKLETLNNLINSADIPDDAKIGILKAYLKEVR